MFTPKAFSIRRAISGYTAALPLTTSDSVARRTPRASAAPLTERPSSPRTSSRMKTPGWACLIRIAVITSVISDVLIPRIFIHAEVYGITVRIESPFLPELCRRPSRRHFLFDRVLDARSLPHALAMFGHAGKRCGIDAVSLQPRREREEVGIGDRIIFPHRPRPFEHPGLDQFETGADALGNLAFHVGERSLLGRPTITPAPVGVSDMHGRAEIGDERLQLREGERVVQRREAGLRKTLRDKGEDRRRLRQNAARGSQRGHAALGIDREIVRRLLLGLAEIEPLQFVARPRILQRDVRSERASAWRVEEREHEPSPRAKTVGPRASLHFDATRLYIIV